MAEVRIGLEVHVRLATRTKLFCSCPVDDDAAPNTCVCPVCLGLPGALPVLNAEAVRLAVRLAVALGCRVAAESSFSRKQYFYPDLPRNFQISQQAHPLAHGGVLDFGPDLAAQQLSLAGLHLEEDAGRSRAAAAGMVAVDFNRAGAPLVEIVTRPDLHAGDEANGALRALRRLLRWYGVSEARMEAGELRCDANISLTDDDGSSGARIELKNLNSARGVARALEYERTRLVRRRDAGRVQYAETRAWDADRRRTIRLRAKESAADYRFLEEPDLPPLTGLDAVAELTRRALPEAPGARARRWARRYGLGEEQIAVLTADRAAADRFDALVRYAPEASIAARWCVGPVAALARERGAAAVPGAVRMGRLLRLEAAGVVTAAQARELLGLMTEDPRDPAALAAVYGLEADRDAAALAAHVAAVLSETPAQVSAYHGGKPELLGWFVGQVLARSGGRADPRRVREAVLEALAGPPGE